MLLGFLSSPLPLSFDQKQKMVQTQRSISTQVSILRVSWEQACTSHLCLCFAPPFMNYTALFFKVPSSTPKTAPGTLLIRIWVSRSIGAVPSLRLKIHFKNPLQVLLSRALLNPCSIHLFGIYIKWMIYFQTRRYYDTIYYKAAGISMPAVRHLA